MLTVYQGRPENTEGRLAKEIRVYDFLDRAGLEYVRVDHNAAHTMEDCLAPEEALGQALCKNLFLCNRQQTVFYLLMIPGDKVFKTKELSHQIGSSRLSFGSPEKMEELLDITPGAMSVMGLMNDHDHKVTLLVDEDLLKMPYVCCHPCVNTSSIRLKREDVFGPFLQAVGHSMTTVALTGEE